MLKRPCSWCGRPSRSNPCGDCQTTARHKQAPRPKLSRQARGYGSAYDHYRKLLAEQIAVYGAFCYRCGQPIPPGAPFHADHIAGKDRPDLLAPSHPYCNTAAGGRTRAARR